MQQRVASVQNKPVEGDGDSVGSSDATSDSDGSEEDQAGGWSAEELGGLQVLRFPF